MIPSVRRILAVFSARNKEFYRDRAALGWSMAFPFLVVLGFAFAFSSERQNQYKVAIHGRSDHPRVARIRATQFVEFIDTRDLEPALEKLKRHQYDLVLSSQPQAGTTDLRYWVNPSAPKGYLAERLLLHPSPGEPAPQRLTLEGQEIRYVDWLISGLIAMNVMFGAFYGVGYTIVRYRKSGVLKRLKATPLRPVEFLLAQLFSRMLVIMGVAAVVFFGTDLLVKFHFVGSTWRFFVVVSCGAFCLISLSLIIAARSASEEFANGLLNLMSWPMMFLSGVWFSLEGANPWVRKAALALPLTHVIDASRAILTEGATLTQVLPSLGALAGMSALFLLIGIALFRWE